MPLLRENEGKYRMRNILVTGGTVFVSKFVAEYFVKNTDSREKMYVSIYFI